jgi:hypothetical protein
LRRGSHINYPAGVMRDEEVMKRIRPEIEKREKSGQDGCNQYINYLMTHQLPQPQTDDWQ